MLIPNVKISDFPTDTTLTGAELLTGIENSTNKNISIQQIADFVIALIGGGGGGGVGDDLVLANTGDQLALADSGDSLVLA